MDEVTRTPAAVLPGPVAMHGRLETTIGADGSLVVSADEPDRVGVHPGDRVRLEPVGRRRVRPMLGHGADPGGFTNDHLREVRSEMGQGIGDDLST